MKKWEYRVIDHKKLYFWNLCEYGKEGWELVSYTSVDNYNKCHEYIFKREI